VPRFSGLDASSGRVAFRVRIGTSMLQEPQDSIDPNLLTAATFLMTEYSGHFTLDGKIAFVDLLGAYGVTLMLRAAYITLQQRVQRVMEIVLPCIVDSMWTQSG
jgi:hypothetical protein